MKDIIIYEPKRKLTFKEFLNKYPNAYFTPQGSSDNTKIVGICYTQGNKDKETDVLEADIFTRSGLGKILAWKLGKIKKDGSYASGWTNCETENPIMYEKYTLDIDSLLQKLKENKEELDKFVKQNKYIEFVNHILDYKIKGIGPVYAITILFFYSKGKYPIYDRFARHALKSIKDKEIPKRKKIKKTFVFEIDYPKYIEAIAKYQKCYQGIDNTNEINYLKYRDLDRALWIYGHGFDFES